MVIIMIFNNIPITSTYQALAYLPHLQLRSIKIAGGPSQPTIKSNGELGHLFADFLRQYTVCRLGVYRHFIFCHIMCQIQEA